MMIMDANTTPEEAPRVLKLLRAELDSLLEDGVYEDELRRAKDKWISSIVLSSESTFSRMRALASDWVTEGRLISIDEEVERVEKVTTEDVMRALRRFPMRDKQVLTALGPVSEEQLLAPHPETRFGPVFQALLHLVGHFAIHRGQMSYIVRLLGKK